jgi:two-component system cell cycle response regulator
VTVVLVADDSPTVRAAVRQHLAPEGYQVIEADNGEEALAVTKAEAPDVVLLDVGMPRLDGLAVLCELQADADLADIPVVFLTARTDAAEVVAGLHAGAHDYLRKPFDGLELVARVSAAARVKRLQDELRTRYNDLNRLSRLDALTGLYNRGHLEEHLADLCSASGRHRFHVTAMLIDLDHFKQINDSYGHPAGDAVLKAAAHVVGSQLRVEDIPGRWGGEEFLVLLPYIDAPSALIVAERIRADIAGLEVGVVRGTTLRNTASIGLCTGIAVDGATLVQRADESLYRAKTAGRNKVAATDWH